MHKTNKNEDNNKKMITQKHQSSYQKSKNGRN